MVSGDWPRFEASAPSLITYASALSPPARSNLRKVGVQHVANIKSQIKRVKTNEKARLRNKSVSSSIKTSIRRFRDALKAGDAAVITTELRSASQALDVAVAKGVVHKNNAANKKSAMAKAAAKVGAR